MDEKISNRATHPAYIYGYAMIIFWVIYNLALSLLEFYHFGSTYVFEQNLWAIVFDVYFIYIAIIALIIGGSAWLVTRILSHMTNHMRAIISGGAVGITLFAIQTYTISSYFNAMSLYRPFILIPICLLSASLGERLARRHIKVDPKSVPKTFE